MRIEISDEAAAGLERLVRSGSFESTEAAVEAAIEHLLQTDGELDVELLASLRVGVNEAGHGGKPATRDLFDQVKARGRTRLASQQP